MATTILLDGLDIKSTYGVIAMRGSYNDLVGLPDMKEPSSYSWPGEDFDDVDLIDRKTASRDITLTFLLSAETIAQLWDLRAGLRNALLADGYRNLTIGALDKTFQVYYKGCQSAQFIRSSKYRIKMVLKFRLDSF
jgi:hypothetical protein